MPAGELWWLPVAAAPFVGSFLGVLVTRLPTGEPVVLARSRCDACGHVLGAVDLVPLLSWLALRGRCRHCRAWIGGFHPGIELAAVAVALWAATELSGWLLWAGCGLGWTLLALALIDVRHLILPDVLTLPLVAAGLAVAWAIGGAPPLDHLLGAAIGFFVFLLIERGYKLLRGREGLGRGDAKLLAAGGAWLGWAGLPGVVLIAAASALIFVCGQALAGRARLAATTRVPFGPFLCLGIWLVWLYGPPLIG